TMRGCKIVRASLMGANFSGADLEGADLSLCDLKKANLNGAVLVNAALSLADLTETNLSGAITNAPVGKSVKDLEFPLEDVLRQHTAWVGSNGRGGKQLDISGFDFRGTSFARACLTMVQAKKTMLYGVSFADAQLQAANMREADLRHANFQSADMRGANL